MRKLLVAVLCAAVAVPAVALAAVAESDGGLPTNERAGALPVSDHTKRASTHRDRVAAEARKRERKRRARKRAAAARSVASPALQAIAACESGGNPRAIGGGGAYRGKYQFDYGTWASVGGSGDPAAASEAEQDRRAAMLYARAGASPWPVCGQ